MEDGQGIQCSGSTTNPQWPHASRHHSCVSIQDYSLSIMKLMDYSDFKRGVAVIGVIGSINIINGIATPCYNGMETKAVFLLMNDAFIQELCGRNDMLFRPDHLNFDIRNNSSKL